MLFFDCQERLVCTHSKIPMFSATHNIDFKCRPHSSACLCRESQRYVELPTTRTHLFCCFRVLFHSFSDCPFFLVSACDPANFLVVEKRFANTENNFAPVGAPVQNPAEVGSLLLRRSVDSGRTWLPMQQIYFRPGLNIDFLSGVNDLHSGKMWLFLQVRKVSAMLLFLFLSHTRT